MYRKLKDSVVVITGASSGIGHATAVRLARRGAHLVLAARRELELENVARECQDLGARSILVPTDVADEDAVEDLAEAAVRQFGRIDVWVNNAAVTLFGAFDHTPSDVYRQVIETNLFGYIHGCRSALPYMRENGHGVIINVGSVDGVVSQPWASAYAISKHGIVALGRTLRQELMLEGEDDIHVVTLLPSTIDTPLFQNAGNYMGRAAVAMPPVNTPESVAKAIERAILNPQREIPVGRYARRAILAARLMPATMERRMAYAVDRQHLVDRPVGRNSGNVLVPGAYPGTIRGGWRRTAGRTALLLAAGVGLLGAGVVAWIGANDPQLRRQVVRSTRRFAKHNVYPAIRQTQRYAEKNWGPALRSTQRFAERYARDTLAPALRSLQPEERESFVDRIRHALA